MRKNITTIETENKAADADLHVLQFVTRTQFLTLKEAFDALRFFIKVVIAFKKSPIGGCPECTSTIEDFNQERHMAVRLVKDEEGLAEYVGYLRDMISQTPGPHPRLFSTRKVPFYYMTARDSARIAIVEYGDAYVITMAAKFATDPSGSIGLTLCWRYGNLITDDECVEINDESELMHVLALAREYLG